MFCPKMMLFLVQFAIQTPESTFTRSINEFHSWWSTEWSVCMGDRKRPSLSAWKIAGWSHCAYRGISGWHRGICSFAHCFDSAAHTAYVMRWHSAYLHTNGWCCPVCAAKSNPYPHRTHPPNTPTDTDDAECPRIWFCRVSSVFWSRNIHLRPNQSNPNWLVAEYSLQYLAVWDNWWGICVRACLMTEVQVSSTFFGTPCSRAIISTKFHSDGLHSTIFEIDHLHVGTKSRTRDLRPTKP